MQYHHRSRLPPPPPPPFGRGGGAGYPRGHMQLYAPPLPPPRPPLPAPPPPPQRRYEVLMEAGRLAAEYLVSKGVLPQSSLQRGGGGGAWVAPPHPPPLLPQQQQEPPAFYGRRRYEDVHSNNNNNISRPRRNSSSSSSSRDDYSTGGNYNGREKRKYGEYRRGYSDWGREREKERGRSSSNGRRYEHDVDDDGAPGFRRDRRSSGGNDDTRSCVTEGVREATPLMKKAVGEPEMEDTRSKAVSSSDDVRNKDDSPREVLGENEEGEMKDDILSPESEVVEQGMDANCAVNKTSIGVIEEEAKLLPDHKDANGAVNKTSTGVVIEEEAKLLPDHKDANGAVNKTSTGVVIDGEAKLLPDRKVTDEKTEENDKVLCKTSLDRIALDGEATNLENSSYVDMKNLLNHYDFAKAPTRPRSVRAHRNAASVHRETETAVLVSSGETFQVVVDEAANERSLTNIQSDIREDQIYQENTSSSSTCNEIMEHVLLQENKTSVVTANIREDKNDAQLHVVQEDKEESDVSPLNTSQKDTLMQETDLSPLTVSPKDNLMQKINLSPLTASPKDGLMQETDLSSLTASPKGGLMQETNLSSLTDTHEDSLIEETNISLLTDSHKDSLIEDIKMSPLTDPHKDSFIEQIALPPLADSHKDSLMQETGLSRTMSSHENNFNLQFNEGAQMCNIEMLPQDVDMIEFSDQRKIIGAELFSNVGAETIIKMEEEQLDQSSPFKMHNNPGLGPSPVEGSSAEPQKQQRHDFVASAGDSVSGADDLCQVSLDNKAVQVIDIEDDTSTELVGFDSSKAKDQMICSSMDDMMHPGLHTDDLPVIQDGYNLAISDYLGADLPCYTSMQPDLQSGICINNSEGIPAMDDPIYGSLTDIGFMDVWGQPAEDFEKFF